jgi:hypothetical protein
MSTRNEVTYGGTEYETINEYSIPPPGWGSESLTPRSLPSKQDYYHHLGYDTPDYYKLLHLGKIIPHTDWTQTKVQGRASGSTYFYGDDPGTGRWHGGYYGSLSKYDGWPVTSGKLFEIAESHNIDYGYLVQEAAASIYNRGWDALTFTAEVHKSVIMFTRVLARLLSIIRSIRALDLDPREVSSAWLEARYGWRILMYDIRDIQKLLEDLDTSRLRNKQRVGDTITNDLFEVVEEVSALGTIQYAVHYNYELSVRGSIIADIAPPKVSLNYIATSWELLTFSFVIDWVYDVGQFLEAMSFLALQTDYSAAYGYKLTGTKTVNVGAIQWNTNWGGDITVDSSVQFEQVRRVPTTVSMRPHGTMNLDTMKVLDLLALIFQLVSPKYT